LEDMEKEVEVKVMTWGSRGWIQVEVIMDEGWDTPVPATIQDNSSRPEANTLEWDYYTLGYCPEEEIEESTTQEEGNEVSTTQEEGNQVSTKQEEGNEVSTKQEECKKINAVTPSLKKVSLPSHHQVEKHQQKCWEKMDSDGDKINAHRNNRKIVGLGNVKNKIMQPRPREKDRIWKEKGRLKKVKMKYENINEIKLINMDTNKSTHAIDTITKINKDTNMSMHAMDTITKIAKMERVFVTPSTFKQLFLIGRKYVAELIGSIFSS